MAIRAADREQPTRTRTRNEKIEVAVRVTGAGEEVRRERTREQILEAARSALIRFGYEHITTRLIADAAGVNVATLHYYFGTKEALLTEAVQFTLQRTMEQLRSVTQNAPDAATALERAFQRTWEMVKERPGVLRYDLVVRGMRQPEAHQQVTRIYQALHTLVWEILERHTAQNALAPGVTIDTLCHYTVAAIDGVILQHIVFADDERTVASLALILRHIKSCLLVSDEGSDALLKNDKEEIQ